MKLPAWVYILQHDATGKIYVGLSANPTARIHRHLYNLRAGRHPVEDFQDDYNTRGADITALILEKVETYEDRNKELKWQLRLHTMDRRYGYNYKDPTAKWRNRGLGQSHGGRAS